MASGVTKQVSKQREVRAWKLRVEDNWTENEIAAHLGVSQPAVSQMLSRVSRRAEAELTDEARLLIVEQLAELRTIFTESIKAWERSKQQSVRVRKHSGSKTAREETIHEILAECGDPQFIDRALKALAAQRELLGLGVERKKSASAR